MLRVWQLNSVGFNSDEAVYSGQAAAIADDPELDELFPIFRAHPLLVQTVLSLGFRLDLAEGFERLASVAAGVATVYLVYELGRLLYGRRAGLIAALLLALMPYHVVVTRQVLLDGPMTLFATLTLLLAGALRAQRPAGVAVRAPARRWGSRSCRRRPASSCSCAIYAFLALTPELRVRLRDLAISLAVMVARDRAVPAQPRARPGAPARARATSPGSSSGARTTTGSSTRRRAGGDRPAGAARRAWSASWLLRTARPPGGRRCSCRWIAVPVAFFQLWPVKGFQYLLPIAPPLAVLAARALAGADARRARPEVARRSRSSRSACSSRRRRGCSGHRAATRSWPASGGLPGGRETGEWIDAHVPEGATFMTIGPSMANLVQFYGHRKAYGLSVSPNPLNRNPSYEPLINPDRALRDSDIAVRRLGHLLGRRALRELLGAACCGYADRYDGRAVHAEVLPGQDGAGRHAPEKPAIVVYEVRP